MINIIYHYDKYLAWIFLQNSIISYFTIQKFFARSMIIMELFTKEELLPISLISQINDEKCSNINSTGNNLIYSLTKSKTNNQSYLSYDFIK